MDIGSPQEERLKRVRELALVIANGGQWTPEQADEAANLAEIKQALAGWDGKVDLVQRLEGQITSLRKKV